MFSGISSIFRFTSATARRPLFNVYHTSAPLGVEYRGKDYKYKPVVDEGAQGEKVMDLDTLLTAKQTSIFPTEESENMLFNGTPYKQLPICNISATHNNTIVSLTDSAGVIKIIRSCGVEGFKNTKKGTNIAAQTTAITMGQKAIEKGYSTVRVRVRGLGPGRLAAVKGLQMAGLNIVSVTDSTKVSWNPPRPRKAKRL